MDINDNSNIEAFVLREFNYRESSKIIEVFAKDLGKISIIAKGVLNKKNSNLSSTQRFVKASYNLYRSGDRFYGIKDASLINSYSKSNKNFDIIIYKSAICDLLLRTIDLDQRDFVYNLIDTSWESFEKASENYLNIFLCFLLKYISFSGFKPNLKDCSYCGEKINPNSAFFSIENGGLICHRCKKHIRDRIYISRDEYLYILKLLYTPSVEVSQIDISIDKKKISKLIIDYCLECLDIKKFSSLEWVMK
ncbi:DNA repair protein RecO [Anaerococcus sp. AGMB00486]|uniref:DNA repair protein RecO n=2 Tax=Anaerococcus TaxID=165779 RepID=A0ABX2NAK0_9FIRM|nr:MULTISPECIES: DNA repair protein RecO [Anaerococcus]MDY3006933.1 DNA repair protein RecO [Anaerococcus porci]MSS78541.1 DNA repair protein RecO [Anaerococcus porci]NVF11735.1 DNA repair protein RecO [Anaerococcus faecalis]